MGELAERGAGRRVYLERSPRACLADRVAARIAAALHRLREHGWVWPRCRLSPPGRGHEDAAQLGRCLWLCAGGHWPRRSDARPDRQHLGLRGAAAGAPGGWRQRSPIGVARRRSTLSEGMATNGLVLEEMLALVGECRANVKRKA